ncbi:MAG: hypothetical protein Q8R05_01190 [Candidatus Omnitrophota bacterium]|nr:hypothetical protein [Candidatus Omnitrophota bacterium]
MRQSGIIVAIIFGLTFISGCAEYQKKEIKLNWDEPAKWEIGGDGKSVIEVTEVPAKVGNGLQIKYELKGDPHGYVIIKKRFTEIPSEDIPITFLIKAEAPSNFEIKFIDADGSTFFKTVSLRGYRDWTQVIVYKNNLEYGWGGDDKFNGLSQLEFAISGQGRGTVLLDEAGFGSAGLKSSFPLAGPILDPDRELPGIGFKQRRDAELIPEDPLVLEWLKQMQDLSSPGRAILASTEDNQAHTFNNSLVAMAFIVKGEKERAERILDFYAKATVRDNDDPSVQNFFYKGEARGFFQYVELNAKNSVAAYHNPGNSDRWMGDMAWMLTAYKYYEKTYNSDRYKEITNLLKDLLISWYKDADDGLGGYIQHGWRKGDSKLHENYGHPEGNIDCYAVLKLCGEDEYADKIKIWLDRVLKGDNLPLDLYTWRVLAFGKDYVALLNIPEYDLRYRKTVTFNGKQAMGFFSSADINVNNVWLDGTGHIACAFITLGDRQRGYFYANQLDAFLIDRDREGVHTRTLPYTANTEGGYGGFRQDKGFISVAAWYIFAKNKFNPLQLEQTP